MVEYNTLIWSDHYDRWILLFNGHNACNLLTESPNHLTQCHIQLSAIMIVARKKITPIKFFKSTAKKQFQRYLSRGQTVASFLPLRPVCCQGGELHSTCAVALPCG